MNWLIAIVRGAVTCKKCGMTFSERIDYQMHWCRPNN